jgi:hypothetical protein
MSPREGIKLLLLRDEDVTDDVRNAQFYHEARRTIDRLEKTAIEVCADFLGWLFRWGMEKIEGEHGPPTSPIYLVITIPGNWKDYTRQCIFKAAELAGITNDWKGQPVHLQTRTEPETAAMALLKGWTARQLRELDKGDIITVLDLGKSDICPDTVR